MSASFLDGEGEYRAKPSTSAQHDYARRLMRRLELSTFDITLMHRRYFIAAGFTSSEFDKQHLGRVVDHVLDVLDKDQCSRLIRELDKEASNGR